MRTEGFNPAHPDTVPDDAERVINALRDAYDDGWQAGKDWKYAGVCDGTYYQGRPRRDPHPDDSDLSISWRSGFRNAKD